MIDMGLDCLVWVIAFVIAFISYKTTNRKEK